MSMSIRANMKSSAQCGGGLTGKIQQAAGQRRPAFAVRAKGDGPLSAREFYMLKGLTAAKNDQLQRLGHAVERQLFRSRVKNPTKTLAGVCCALREAGWVRIKAKWCDSLLAVGAKIGAERKRRLRRNKFLGADDCLLSDLMGAARQVGLQPGIEDIDVDVAGQKVLGTVSAVPVMAMDAALDRMLMRFIESRRDGDRLTTNNRPRRLTCRKPRTG